MKNNIAEIKDVSINIEELRTAWSEQLIFTGNYSWEPRNYVDLEFFTSYFQQLLSHIADLIDEKPKDYIIQIHDPNLVTNKWYLTDTHRDADRNTCITLPVYYNRMEPINFYNDVNEVPGFRKDKSIKANPNQIAQYSEMHPTLVNVNNYHNVRVLDVSEPRIFIQMSYDLTFDDFISKNINIRIL
jgi:hypothetical protein